MRAETSGDELDLDDDVNCRSDVVLTTSNGGFTVWRGQPNGSLVETTGLAANSVDPNWKVASLGDFNGDGRDGRDDALMRNAASGELTVWSGQARGQLASSIQTRQLPTSTLRSRRSATIMATDATI